MYLCIRVFTYACFFVIAVGPLWAYGCEADVWYKYKCMYKHNCKCNPAWIGPPTGPAQASPTNHQPAVTSKQRAGT